MSKTLYIFGGSVWAAVPELAVYAPNELSEIIY
jgi:hypothetical protein